MKYINVASNDLNISNIALGCMRISKMSVEDIEKLVLKAIDLGINFFDHADIYGGGKSEELFGSVLEKNPNIREKIIIQTKCGICRGYYDSSKEHILESVERSLTRLKTDYIDILLLHRPDALTDYEEVAEAFNYLYESKKVRYFGVSNMNSFQIELLQKFVKPKIIFNQLQYSVVHSLMIDEGVNVNMTNNGAINRGGSVLDYCRLNDITVQAWSVLQASWEDGSFLNNPKYARLNETLNELSEKYQTTPSAVALNWILRHPAHIQAIAGTTSTIHLEEICQANSFELTRPEWYKLYLSVGKMLP